MIWDTIVLITGTISTVAFVVIAIGDTLMAAMDAIVKKTTNTTDDLWAAKIEFWWEAIKEVYEIIRSGIDKVSIYSRPRKPVPPPQ